MRFGETNTAWAKRKNFNKWRPWYAWRPVKLTNGEWCWGEHIYRKNMGYYNLYSDSTGLDKPE